MSDDHPVRRRDLLTTAAFAMAGAGTIAALYPFVAALGPDAETMARRITFNLDPIPEGEAVTIGVGSEPVLLLKRTEQQLATLRDPHRDLAFRDQASMEPWQPGWAANWHRSLKPEIMACGFRCTYDPWVVLSTHFLSRDLLMCPHCGSQYDLAGRAFHGPAKHNLLVPPYRFVNDHTIEFDETDVLRTINEAMQALRAEKMQSP